MFGKPNISIPDFGICLKDGFEELELL